MASTLVLLLQLLLVSLASASHHYGGTVTFTYKGRYPDRSHRVDIRRRDTFDGCQFFHQWSCNSGNCGSNSRSQRGVVDRSTNAPQFNRQWCETETVVSKKIWSDKPFQERAASCCWIQTRNNVFNWKLLTHVDLGTRSDTRKPNGSPDIAILPFLRVPQNCPRTYNLMSFDPDGDQVRCRYGTASGSECSSCNQPSGFHLNQESCTLHYHNASADPRVFGFELVVEDFPRNHITLTYSDGSRASRSPLTMSRGKRQIHYAAYPASTLSPNSWVWAMWWHHSTPSPQPWWWMSTTRQWTATTTQPTPTTASPWWWRYRTTTTQATTTPQTTNPWWWWWWHSTTTTPSTTSQFTTTPATTTTPWWRWWHSTTTTSSPSTTTTATTSPPTTRPATTTPPTTPWWWWWHSTTTTPSTTSQFTTTPATTTTPWWWWWHSTTTTSSPSTTTTATTSPPTTTTATTTPPTTPWWWWWHSTTTTPSTTSQFTTTPATTTTPWWWRWHSTTTTPSTTSQFTTTPATTTTPWWWWWHSTTTTSSPSTTTTATTSPPTTTTATTTPPTTPWWWWWHSTTTTPSTTSQFTTTPATTTTPWWWRWHSTTTTPSTTSQFTTTPATTTTPWWWWWHSTTTTSSPSTTTTATTSPPTTTTATTTPPTTPWWWWWHSTTTTPSTTSPLTTTPATTTPQTTSPWWWQWHSTTTPVPGSTTTDRARYTTTQSYTTTVPLSKLPLQFSLLVDPPVPSCHEGVYLPKLVRPTPENGALIRAEINKEVEIRVKAEATHAAIHDIIISGPLNITQHRNTNDEFVLRWTPARDDLGDFYPICFAVEAVTGSAATTGHTTQSHHHHATPTSQSGVYQSEMRCVVLNVKSEEGKSMGYFTVNVETLTIVKAHVVCSESTMTVHVEKSSFKGLDEDHLQLSDPSNTACSLQTHSNSSHIIAVIPLNACGTQIEEDNDYLLFKNEITTVDKSTDVITRKHQLEVQFYCQYPKRGNMTLGFTAHRKNVTVWEKGYGTFTYDFEFYPDNQYQNMIDPNSYPLVYEAGSRIYMQIEATSSLNNTELFIDSCRASPYDTPNYHPSYSIIENGCKVDPTVEVYTPQHNKQFRFSMEAFKFIGLNDQVFITCSVLMCEAGNPSTRCSQGCINSTWPSGHQHHKRKREVTTQSGNHFISQGPLRLRRSAESNRATVTNLNLNLNLVFIAGCLLAAVGMICGVILYKSKMSKVKYQPLPTFES